MEAELPICLNWKSGNSVVKQTSRSPLKPRETLKSQECCKKSVINERKSAAKSP